MKNFSEIRNMGKRVLFYTLGTTIVAATIALTLFLLIKPTASASLVDPNFTLPIVEQHSYLSFLMNTVPSNIVQAFVEGNVIGIVFMAMAFSSAILFLPEKQKDFLHTLFSSLFNALSEKFFIPEMVEVIARKISGKLINLSSLRKSSETTIAP
jgi:Na+/H+-dicarboxylate symporter